MGRRERRAVKDEELILERLRLLSSNNSNHRAAYPYVDGDAAKYAIDVLMLLLMFGPVVALLLWWGVACFKRRSRLSRFTSARARSAAQQRANAASIELDTESNNAASTTTPPAWGEQNRVQSRKAVSNVVRVMESE